jgi:hypothetical protein
MDANTLIEATSGISNDEDVVQDHLNHLKLPEPVIDLIKVLIKDLQDDLTLTLVHPQLGLIARLNGQGLNQVIRAVVKFVPASA